MNKQFLGKAGENLAVDYLRSMGHEILERRYKCHTGEIDIISLKHDVIHFVEVKTRTGTEYGMPRESVTRDKLRHIRNTAEVYIKTLEGRMKSGDGVKPQFGYSIDVVEVLVNHIEWVE